MSLPQMANAVKCGFVYLNARVQPNNSVYWTIPQGRIFLLTDLVAQNKGSGDVPVADSDFTRFSITSPAGATDTFFHVVGNHTLNLHFKTGLVIAADNFRFYNMSNSNATFVEFHITGRLRSAD